jgi:hypothetical protein
LPFVHGKDVYYTLNAKDLSAYSNTSQYEKAADSHDVTTYGQGAHVFKGGLLNGTGTVGGIYDSSTSSGPRAIIEPLVGSNVTYVDRPEGTGTGRPQRTADCLVLKYTETRPVADMITWSADLQFSGTVAVVNQT